MDLALTVLAPGDGGVPADVLVSAEPGTRLGQVRADLLAAVGRSEGEIYCQGRALADDTLLGQPPLLQGALLTVGRPGPVARAGLLELEVYAGPAAGHRHPLGVGEHVVGRSPDAAVRLDDPDVSRAHALLRVGLAPGSGTTIHDLGSTNGVEVDGVAVGSAGLRVRPGQELRVGSSRLRLVTPSLALPLGAPDGAGHVVVNRPPRPVRPPARAEVRLPTPPAPREPHRLPWVAVALPAVLGLGLAVVLQSVTYLLFLLLSPVLMLGTALSERVTTRRSARADQQRYAAALLDAQQRVERLVAADRADRLDRFPDLATTLRVAEEPGRRLWQRRPDSPDFLHLRLGLGRVPSSVSVVAPPAHDPAPEPAQPVLDGSPVAVDLAAAGVVGVSAPPARLAALARSLLGQLATWHSPREVRTAVLAPDRTLGWARWLPHDWRPGTADDELLAALAAELDARLERRARLRWDEQREPRIVLVLVEPERVRTDPALTPLLTDGPSVGIVALCLAGSTVDLPSQCRAVAEVVGETGTTLRLADHTGATFTDVTVDAADEAWAQRLARALAPLRDATTDPAALPPDVRLLDLVGPDVADAPDVASLTESVAARWIAHPRGTTVPLGVTAGPETLHVDLVADGPHLLVAGTTGAGKSELLQSLVAGLALANRPDELAFLLVDYKGGAAFRECADLPHTVGLVTDLDEHLTARALQSLSAELRRREQLLKQAGSPDLAHYQRTATPGSPAIPRLVLVVDEFATLAQELPDFVGGLVGVAQRGRSLGLHLVLATQRPAGAVSADIRANTALRIALRVTDPGESMDVVEVPDAAALDPAAPGRAIVRTGGRTAQVQVARVTSARRGVGGPRVRPLRSPALHREPPDEDTDLAALVAATRRAADRLAVTAAPSPWLPALPDLLRVDDLAAPAGVAVLGLVDEPHAQRQRPLTVDPAEDAHLLVAGGPRSGRTTLLRTLAATLAGAAGPDALHLHAVDAGGGLAAVQGLPHCGTVVGRDEPERVARLFDRLEAEVDRRLGLLARLGVGSVAEQRRGAAEHDRLPWLFLLVDGWESLHPVLEEVDHGAPVERLHRLVRDGAAAGLRLVLAGDRGLLTQRIAAGFGRRVLLPLADPGDYALAGIPPRSLPGRLPPGRALVDTAPTQAQVAVLGDGTGAGQVAALAALAERLRVRWGDAPDPGRRPLRLVSLPRLVLLDPVLAEAKALDPPPDWVLLGVGGDDAAPAGVDLGRDGPALTVLGPPRSGRSTALAAAARWLLERGRRVVVVSGAASPLHGWAGRPGVLGPVTASDATALAALLAQHPGAAVLVDDAEALQDSPVEAVLLAALSPAAAPRPLLLAAHAGDAAVAFRGLTVEARRSRSGVLLGSLSAGESELLGVRRWVGRAGPPGRGLLVVRGRPSPVQIAASDL